MYKVITIGNKDYRIEYTVEAALYKEGLSKLTNLLSEITGAKGVGAVKELLQSLTDVPGTTLQMFYAGLLEYHGIEGDKSVLTISDAKALLKQYIKETNNTFFGVLSELLEQMENDGFFAQVGLTQLVEGMQKLQSTTNNRPKKKA